ncbi:MAG: 50S ribosomal protein L31 [Candidatus Moranbacteria bacterium]|nr:50S ribosomal protein L31 [Candidatus Moranbacteria bacterium]
MKKTIHPTYYPQATITCSCGAVLTTGSTQSEMTTEICSACHPFYTGKKKMIDTTGRVDRFKKLSEKSAVKKEAIKAKPAKIVKEKIEKKNVIKK